MKSMIAMLYLAFPLVLTAAGPSAEEMAFYKAYKNGAQAKKMPPRCRPRRNADRWCSRYRSAALHHTTAIHVVVEVFLGCDCVA